MKFPNSLQRTMRKVFYDKDLKITRSVSAFDSIGAPILHGAGSELVYEGKGNCIPGEKKPMTQIFGEYVSGDYYMSVDTSAYLQLGDMVKANNVPSLLKIEGLRRVETHWEARLIVHSGEGLVD